MEGWDNIVKDMMAKAATRAALPCSLLYHDTDVRQPHRERAFYGTWVFEAPYAHSMWHQYVVMLFDITTPTPQGDPVFYKPNMTHEVWCFALQPDDPFVTPPAGTRTADLKGKIKMLTPANFGYQFPAATDADALKRIDDLVMRFIKKTMSPDTDFRQAHDMLFADGAACRKSVMN